MTESMYLWSMGISTAIILGTGGALYGIISGRLGRIEVGQAQISGQATSLIEHVKTQNGRIDRLEADRTRLVDRELLSGMLGRNVDQFVVVGEKIAGLQKSLERVERAVFEELVPQVNQLTHLRGGDPVA